MDRTTWASVCGIIAGTLALFGSVSLFGAGIPLATMPHAINTLAGTLMQAFESLQSLDASSGRLSVISAFLQSAQNGELSYFAMALSLVHDVICCAAIALAVHNLTGTFRTWQNVLAGSLVITDALAVCALCASMSWQLYLTVRSVAQGNPWAVGRGVAGLDTTLTPSLGLLVAAVLGAVAIGLSLYDKRVRQRSAGKAPSPVDQPTDARREP